MLQAYRFDENGYYIGQCAVQNDPATGDLLLPPDCTMDAPVIQDGYFARFVDGAWTSEKIPTSCAEAVDAGMSCISNGPGVHNREVKAVMEALVAAESDAYKTVIDDSFVMTIEAIPEKTFDEVKAEKEQELATVAGQYDQYKCEDMYIIHSDGIKYNADIRSQTNMQGLIDVLSAGESTYYKDFDNTFHSLTREDLISLKANCIANGQALYQQKWEFQAKIENCTTVEELNAIEIVFEMSDFS